MFGNAHSAKLTGLLALCLLALLLAATWPSSATAQPGNPYPPTAPDGSIPGGPNPGPTAGPPTTPGPTATPSPTRRPDSNLPPGPPATPTSPGGLPSDPTASAEESRRRLERALAEFERIKALAPNRIIFHAATPIQLSKVEDGLQVYYIGDDGKTSFGPWVPGFAELAAKHPDGTEASIYLGTNPLTGKRVKIDYLPHVNRIRVDTFYPDKDNDINKQYIFHFGPDHDITYDAW